MDIHVQQLILNNNYKTWLETYAPLIVGIITAILGVVVAFVPYLTEKGRVRKQIIVQKEIDDLVDFKAKLHAYYYKIIIYFNSSKIDDKNQLDEILKNIFKARLDFTTSIDLVNHYFNEEENEKIENFDKKILLQDLDTIATLNGKEKFYQEKNKYTYDGNKKLFKELIKIISKKIHG